MINNITPNSFHQKCNKTSTNIRKQDLAFGNKISIPQSVQGLKVERLHQKIEFKLRKLVDKINVAINHKSIDKKYEKLTSLDEKSSDYMVNLFNYGKAMARAKEVEINIENGSLMNIAKSDDPCIFIMNHNNQKQDPKLLGIFNSLLTREYILNGKAESCPRPKIILNDDILTSSNPKTRAILEKLGAVGVDASLFSPNLLKNGRNLFPVIKDFIANKANLFIFPEGKMCAFKDFGLEYKFQTGIADIIGQLAKRKDKVKVVPLGFAYNGKMGSIHIGEPIYFKKEGQQMLATSGNINSDFTSEKYKDFFASNDKGEYKTITENGKPVEGEDLSDYVAGILCENLKVCKEESKAAFSKLLKSQENTVYSVDL